MKTAAIVLAAGSGKRMYESGMQDILAKTGAAAEPIKKQYMEVNGYPILYYSLKAFAEAGVDEIILVTGESDIPYCREQIVEKYEIPRVSAIVAGGRERYHSVMNGLQAVTEADYVLIHDGARPCVTQEMIARCLQDVQQYDSAVAAMPVKDTIKRADAEGIVIDTPLRSELYLIQTPQTFSYELVQFAYDALARDTEAVGITDDAMVVERYTDRKIRLTRGDYRNIKVTTPEDLLLAEAFLVK